MYNMISKICIQFLGQNVLSTTFYILKILKGKINDLRTKKQKDMVVGINQNKD